MFEFIIGAVVYVNTDLHKLPMGPHINPGYHVCDRYGKPDDDAPEIVWEYAKKRFQECLANEGN